jgi:sodium/hydrogen antiporter
MTLFTIFIVLIFLYSLVSARLERTVLTAPILFTVAGMIVLGVLPELREKKPNLSVFLTIAEIGLVLLLFTDASRTNLEVLKSVRNLPVRLLSTGMLLTILLGALAALAVLPQLTLWEAGALSAILAPTDAGLGQIIVNSPRVPQRIRQALNVEAGLNDGLSVPFLLFFIGLAAMHQEGHQVGFLRVMAEQLGLGTLIGAGCGLIGGWLLGFAHRREWPSASFEQLGVVAVPLICALACKPAGASVFIGAFVAGLAVQVGFPEAGKHSGEFTEEWGQVFNLCVFFLFGIIIARNWGQFNLPLLGYAILSLTVVRMLPVAIALIGTGLSRATVAFMGWFGPRGLASIVLGLVFLEEEPRLAGERTITLAVMLTVWLSIFAHGLSAIPGMNWYARKIATLTPGSAELKDLPSSLPRPTSHVS